MNDPGIDQSSLMRTEPEQTNQAREIRASTVACQPPDWRRCQGQRGWKYRGWYSHIDSGGLIIGAGATAVAVIAAYVAAIKVTETASGTGTQVV